MACIVDVFARYIIGWRVGRIAHTAFVLDALKRALDQRRPAHRGGLVHHSDRGSQYVAIKYTERLAQAGIKPSIGNAGDSYVNARAETINSRYKAGLIHRRPPWKSFEAVDIATPAWLEWFNTGIRCHLSRQRWAMLFSWRYCAPVRQYGDASPRGGSWLLTTPGSIENFRGFRGSFAR